MTCYDIYPNLARSAVIMYWTDIDPMVLGGRFVSDYCIGNMFYVLSLSLVCGDRAVHCIISIWWSYTYLFAGQPMSQREMSSWNTIPHCLSLYSTIFSTMRDKYIKLLRIPVTTYKYPVPWMLICPHTVTTLLWLVRLDVSRAICLDEHLITQWRRPFV